jgi:hypothetical protein
VFHVIGELASHHPLLFCPMSASLWGLHQLPVVVIAPFTIVSAVFTIHFQLFSSLGKKLSCKICFQVLHFKNANRWMHFQGKLLEIPDEILQVSEELQTQIFSNLAS